MELGLLSNMLVNSQPYWQVFVPPLFSAIAGDRTNVRIVAPPPVAWSQTHRVEIGSFTNQSAATRSFGCN